MYRQGDVFVIPDDTPAPEVEASPRDDGRVILAYGEVTGHAHAIVNRAAKLYPPATPTSRSRHMVLGLDAVLRHEEHGPIELPAGNYRVRQQTEYTPEEVRAVAD